MTDQEKELRMRISMLIDSDLEGGGNPRLIDKLEEDAELKAIWARYSLIGDVMRFPQSAVVDRGFAEKVSARLEKEPTVLAPKAPKRGLSVRPSIVSWALAASLAVMAIMVGKSMNDHSEVFQSASASSAKTQVAGRGGEPFENLAESQFNDYLVMHSETAYMAGSAGMLPHVRLIDSRPDR